MTAPVRTVSPWLAALLPGLRGGPLAAPAVADFPPELVAAIVTTPAQKYATGTAATLQAGTGRATFRRTLPDVMPSIVMSGGVLEVPNMVVGPAIGGPHPETVAKQEAALLFAGASRPAGTVATWVGVSDELVEDAAGLESWLSTFLGFLVKSAEERVLLLGNGVATPIVGFMDPALNVPVHSGGATTQPKILIEMIAQAAASGMVPDTIVAAPGVWAELVTDSLFSGDGSTFGGLDLIMSPALVGTQCLVGPVQSLSVIGREGGTIVEGTQSHALDFTHNRSAIRAASRLALGVLMTSAFVKKAV